jgi:hypothetical protein
MKNKYTGNDVPPSFAKLQYDTPLTLNQYDQPYFAVRCEKQKVSIDSNGFNDPFKSIKSVQFAVVENPNADPKITAELMFLKMLDLMAQRGNKYYVHPHAAIFYDPKTGIFNPRNKDEQAFRKLLKTYTLPGRFWRNYYLSYYLPENEKKKSRLDDELIEVEQEFLGLLD